MRFSKDHKMNLGIRLGLSQWTKHQVQIKVKTRFCHLVRKLRVQQLTIQARPNSGKLIQKTCNRKIIFQEFQDVWMSFPVIRSS